jgi:cytochrome P450
MRHIITRVCDFYFGFFLLNLFIFNFPDYYHKANEFDGFRFSDIREAAVGFDTIRHQMVHTTPEHVTFGHGRHSCPGSYI